MSIVYINNPLIVMANIKLIEYNVRPFGTMVWKSDYYLLAL